MFVMSIYFFVSNSASKNGTHQKTPLGVTTPSYESTTKKNLIKVSKFTTKVHENYLLVGS